MYINQLTSKYGSMTKGFRHIKDYLWFVFEAFERRMLEVDVEKALGDHERFQILVKEKPILSKKPKRFSADARQLKLISDTLSNALSCAYCGAKIDNKSMHLDHAKEKSAGGVATTDNANGLTPIATRLTRDTERSPRLRLGSPPRVISRGTLPLCRIWPSTNPAAAAPAGADANASAGAAASGLEPSAMRHPPSPPRSRAPANGPAEAVPRLVGPRTCGPRPASVEERGRPAGGSRAVTDP